MTTAAQQKDADFGKLAKAIMMALSVGPPLVAAALIAKGMNDYPAKRAAEIDSYKRTVIGNCLDVSPLPHGKAVDIFDNDGVLEVKVALTDANGSQSLMLMPLDLALKDVVSCSRN
jgi:hypothetical protein|nr:hypothetical protein [Neorhizobium tomejilense]